MAPSRRAAALVVSTLVSLAAAPIPSAQMPPRRSPPMRVTNMDRGDGEEVDLFTLASDVGQYEGKLVRTAGRFEPLLEFDRDHKTQPMYVLTTGRASLLAVPGYGFSFADLETLIDGEVQVRGVVRPLGSARTYFDLAQYSDLPPVPDWRAGLPRVSVTFLAISRSFDGREDQALGHARRILAEPERYAGKRVQLLGRFRGRNLFGDLPPSSRRGSSDWVLKDGEISVWVTGKKPRGKGFSLDPTDRGDASKWLAVEGRAEVADGIVYLKASRVLLMPAPASP